MKEHRHAITLAFRTRIRLAESIRQSVDDGAPTFEATRDKVQYRLAQTLAEHGVMLTRRAPR